MNGNLVITGSIGFDYIMDFNGKFADRIMPDKIHNISLSFLVDEMKKNWGGTAGNTCYSLGLLGINPILLGSAGNDLTPYKTFLEKTGVNTSYVSEHADVSTGTYFVITDSEDNQIGAFYTGGLRYAADLSLTDIKEQVTLVLIGPNDPAAMKKYVDECLLQKIPHVYDPAFQIDNFSKEELQKGVSGAKILIGNDYEIELILQKLSLTKEALLQTVPIVITTLGSKGALIETGKAKAIEIAPAKPANISDPTGAGDAFRAGFLAGFVRDFDLETCGRMGAVAAVYTVEKYGTTTHTFTKEEFAKRYQENYGKELVLT